MKETFRLLDHESVANINSAMVAILALDDDKEHLVEIRPRTETTSTRQRKYYWKIIEIISEFTGATKDDQHWEYKQAFLVGIFRRREDGEYEKDLIAANKLYELGEVEAFKRIRAVIIRNTSIMKAKVPEMAEYLSLVIQHGEVDLGLSLPHPEDKKILKYKEAQ